MKKFMRFVMVGGIATATQYAILILLVEFLQVYAVVASAIGFVISSILNYRLNYSFTFSSNRSHRAAFPRFFLTAIIGLLINTGTMLVCLEIFGLYYIVSQVLATGTSLVWNFVVNSAWSFREIEEG